MQRHPVISFLVIAFVWTWSYDGAIYVFFGAQPWPYLTLPSTWGLPLAAGIVTWVIGGDVREWVEQGLKWEVDLRWYLVALGLPVILAELEQFLWVLVGGEVRFRGESLPSFFALYIGGFLLVTFFAGASRNSAGVDSLTLAFRRNIRRSWLASASGSSGAPGTSLCSSFLIHRGMIDSYPISSGLSRGHSF